MAPDDDMKALLREVACVLVSGSQQLQS